jgi:hypothetical protein
MEFQDLCDSLKKFQIRKFSIMQASTPIAMEQKKIGWLSWYGKAIALKL